MEYLKGSVAQLEEKFQDLNTGHSSDGRKTGPLVPPKPYKSQPKPEIPQSCYVGQACKPLYSKRLQFADTGLGCEENSITSAVTNSGESQLPLLQRKKHLFGSQNNFVNDVGKVTLDNPAILEQQLEVLAHHKKQLERKGLLPKQSLHNVPKLSSTSLVSSGSDVIYANMLPSADTFQSQSVEKEEKDNVLSNVDAQRRFFENVQAAQAVQREPAKHRNLQSKIYSNTINKKNEPDDSLHTAYPQAPLTISCPENLVDDMQTPPSPVSSSYSELRRANDIFSIKKNDNVLHEPVSSINASNALNSQVYLDAQNYMNLKYKNEFGNHDTTDYYDVGNFSQASSTYESIYEPINPRPSSQLSSGSKFLNYSPYVNNQNAQLSNSNSLNLLSMGGIETTPDTMSFYSSGGGNGRDHSISSLKTENEVDTLTNFLVHSMDGGNDIDNYGICFKCNERVLGENSGCTAMNQIYHIACFTCSQCQINLQGKPFYALDGKPFCEYDYLQTLEKCSVCMKPILERILRATGKPYHPQCFTCIVCGKSLDGIPFTVDATNQNYCIEDFHKKFAPRCCVCKEPIMPEPGEEETVRVVALDRSFHFECYRCEDCGLLLSSEAEGRGCYPLDDHVLCKSCNAKRVQLLTNCITTEI